MSKAVLLVGNFISGHSTRTRQVCEDLADQLQRAGWTVIRTSVRLNRLARLADMMTTTWRHRHKYEVAYVEVFSGPSFIWAEVVAWLLRRARKPYVLTLHGGALPIFAQRWPGRVRRLLESGTAVTVPSAFLKEQMLPFCPEGIRLLPNALNTSAYPVSLRNKPAPKILWLRAFGAEYNPALLLDAASRLVDDFPTLQISMVGPDKGALVETQHAAARFGLADRVAFPGRVDKQDVPTWMAQHDLFINTTNVDNTPVSVIEAMVCGLVIISTNVGGIPYLLEHEHDALLVPPEDPEQLANAMRRVLNDPALATRLSQNARQKAEQFDWAGVLPQWEDLLCEVQSTR